MRKTNISAPIGEPTSDLLLGISETKVAGWNFHLYSGTSNVGIVLIHEVFGFDSYIESVGQQLSSSGFWVAAVDLYHGKYASDLEEARRIRSSLKESDVLEALNSGLGLLRARIGNGAKVGSMGFCMGGGFALLGACNLDFSFCIDYYGMVENAQQVKGLKGPVQIILASEDARITPWAYSEFLPAATRHKKRVDAHLYPNVHHAFHRPNWERHNAEAAKDAWSKTIEFASQFKEP
jgi:carboxymethylenebutenolidase